MSLNRLLAAGVMMLFLLTTTSVYAQSSRVVTFGADLTLAQQQSMLKVFGISPDTAIPRQQVTISEERHYLKGLIPDQVIGNKSISSVSVELLPAGQGLTTQVHNITWVTADMYSNALATAGVKDARIIAAAPFPVSGTAALTGIMKAFETASGTKLSEERKKAASEELVRTGELGQQLQNKEQAAKLIMLIKQQVVKEGLNDPEAIKAVVSQTANQLQINLSPQQVDTIVTLMLRLSRTNINLEEMNKQLAGLQEKWNVLVAKEEEARGILESIWTALADFFETLMNKIRAIFG
ncbi:MAG TPA: DUF1002 domain-containing protein [Bacillota bacterium]|nr:DUF1002 domain-containing protein [Bacillota bacterium]